MDVLKTGTRNASRINLTVICYNSHKSKALNKAENFVLKLTLDLKEQLDQWRRLLILGLLTVKLFFDC